MIRLRSYIKVVEPSKGRTAHFTQISLSLSLWMIACQLLYQGIKPLESLIVIWSLVSFSSSSATLLFVWLSDRGGPLLDNHYKISVCFLVHMLVSQLFRLTVIDNFSQHGFISIMQNYRCFDLWWFLLKIWTLLSFFLLFFSRLSSFDQEDHLIYRDFFCGPSRTPRNMWG